MVGDPTSSPRRKWLAPEVDYPPKVGAGENQYLWTAQNSSDRALRRTIDHRPRKDSKGGAKLLDGEERRSHCHDRVLVEFGIQQWPLSYGEI